MENQIGLFDKEAQRQNSEAKYCDCCGQKIRKLNPHTMDKSKVKLLLRIFYLNETGIEWVKIQQDTSLIKKSEEERTIQCDAVHASRLKWFGLLDLKGKRSGEYKINEYGINFLQGKLSVPKRIWCSKGAVIERDSEKVFIGKVKGIALNKNYWDDYYLEQKTPTFQQQMKREKIEKQIESL